ncbi:hypothetical protein ACWCXH_32160 [Kitasatospora sp. NPDC001660]
MLRTHLSGAEDQLSPPCGSVARPRNCGAARGACASPSDDFTPARGGLPPGAGAIAAVRGHLTVHGSSEQRYSP